MGGRRSRDRNQSTGRFQGISNEAGQNALENKTDIQPKQETSPKVPNNRHSDREEKSERSDQDQVWEIKQRFNSRRSSYILPPKGGGFLSSRGVSIKETMTYSTNDDEKMF